MQRAMVFIDYENFEIARQKLYKRENLNNDNQLPWIDLVEFPKKLIDYIDPDLTLLKTFLFAPKPDDNLMEAQGWRKKTYDFLNGLNNVDHYSMISGRHVVRPVNDDYSSIDFTDKSTYYICEKGTDINIAVETIKKAFFNSYDVAIIVSGDTDYLPVYDTLNSMGKLVIVVAVNGQSVSSVKMHTDKQVILGIDFLKDCEKVKVQPI